MNIPQAERTQENQSPCIYKNHQVYIWALAPIGSYNYPYACISLVAPMQVKKVTDTHHKWVPLEDVQIQES